MTLFPFIDEGPLMRRRLPRGDRERRREGRRTTRRRDGTRDASPSRSAREPAPAYGLLVRPYLLSFLYRVQRLIPSSAAALRRFPSCRCRASAMTPISA